MKSKITEDIKEILSQSVNWAKLEVEYLKLTFAEKMIIIMGMAIIGAIFLLLLVPIVLMLLFALAQVFVDMMPVAVAYVTVAGIVLLLLLILFLLRRPLIINPLSRKISKILLEKNSAEK